MTILSFTLIFLYSAAITFLLIGLISGRWIANDEPDFKHAAGITVVVAFRNERNNLPALINSLMRQDLPREFWEIILVNDGSTDGSAEQMKNLKSDVHLRLLSLPKGQMGKKQALLYGISHARYSIIVFTDADCTHSPQWLSTIAAQMEHHDFLQCEVVPVVDSGNLLSMFEALDYVSLMAVSAASFSLGCPVIASSANMVFNSQKIYVDASALRTDIASGDDMFLLHHAKRLKGLRIGFASSSAIAAHTRFDGGLIGFFRRRSRWASKSLAYNDLQTILLGLLVLSINLLLVVLLMLTIAGTVKPLLLFFVWLAKGLVDFSFMAYYLYRTKQLKLLSVFILLQVLYPFYISASAIVGFIKGTSWKGRSIG